MLKYPQPTVSDGLPPRGGAEAQERSLDGSDTLYKNSASLWLPVYRPNPALIPAAKVKLLRSCTPTYLDWLGLPNAHAGWARSGLLPGLGIEASGLSRHAQHDSRYKIQVGPIQSIPAASQSPRLGWGRSWDPL